MQGGRRHLHAGRQAAVPGAGGHHTRPDPADGVVRGRARVPRRGERVHPEDRLQRGRGRPGRRAEEPRAGGVRRPEAERGPGGGTEGPVRGRHPAQGRRGRHGRNLAEFGPPVRDGGHGVHGGRPGPVQQRHPGGARPGERCIATAGTRRAGTRRGGEPSRHGSASHHRRGPGRGDADGGHVGHCRRGRPEQRDLRLPVAGRRRRHIGSDRLDPHPGRRR